MKNKKTTLFDPEYYLEKIKEDRYYSNKNLKLIIEKRANRHRTDYGKSWGWYEIFPIGYTVGYWAEDRFSDLDDNTIKDWNLRAEKLFILKSEGK